MRVGCGLEQCPPPDSQVQAVSPQPDGLDGTKVIPKQSGTDAYSTLTLYSAFGLARLEVEPIRFLLLSTFLPSSSARERLLPPAGASSKREMFSC